MTTNFKIQYEDSLLYETRVLTDVIGEQPAEFISFIISGEAAISYEEKGNEGNETRCLNVKTTLGDFDSVNFSFSNDDDEDAGWSALLQFDDGKKFTLNLKKLNETESYPKWMTSISATWFTNGFSASDSSDNHLRRNLHKFSRFALKQHPKAFQTSMTVTLKTSVERMWNIVTNFEDHSWVMGSKSVEAVDDGSAQIARIVTFEEREDQGLWERVCLRNKKDLEFAYEYGQNQRHPPILYYLGFVTFEHLGTKLCKLTYEITALTSLTKEQVESMIQTIFDGRPEWFKKTFDEKEEEESSQSHCRMC